MTWYTINNLPPKDVCVDIDGKFNTELKINGVVVKSTKAQSFEAAQKIAVTWLKLK